MSDALDRLMNPGVNGNSVTEAAHDETVAENAPMFHRWFTMNKYRDADRMTPTLNIWTEDGRFKVCLSDRQTGMVAFLTLRSLDSAFQDIDRALDDGNVEWKPSKMRGGK